MWLLNTARAELKFFPTPESVPGGYAILSHVWDEQEQTFQEPPSPPRQFCILSEHGEHEWGWADTCCIDKTSSTDLSEAITAMYRYYSLADVCYAYLRDVPTANVGELRKPWSSFRGSQWHKRGWTLQELIASPFVILVSNTWELLGAKADLADLLEKITRVPTAVLKLEDKPSSYCVAARMSWALDRETTRPEDEAYCLMGIFGIFMPPLYGEGKNAFLRLQEEIMRQVDDPSIFAWGYPLYIHGMNLLTSGILKSEEVGSHLEHITLFARSPSDFFVGHQIKHRAERPQAHPSLLEKLKIWESHADMSKLPTFNTTPYGVMAHLPVFTSANKNILLALLLGIELEAPGAELEASGAPARNVGLLLRRIDSRDHTRQLYVPCSYRLGWESSRRLVVFEGDPLQVAVGTKSTLEWRTIYIVHNPPMTGSLGLQMVSRSLRTPFYIPPSEITAWKAVASYSLHPPHPIVSSWRRYVALKVDLSAPGNTPASTVVVYLGLCTKSLLVKHWAMIVEYEYLQHREPEEPVEHVCAEHHVDEQPTQIHPLTIYNAKPTIHHAWSLSARKSLVWLELSFLSHPLSFTDCRRVSIRFKSTEDNLGSSDDELITYDGEETTGGEWVSADCD